MTVSQCHKSFAFTFYIKKWANIFFACTFYVRNDLHDNTANHCSTSSGPSWEPTHKHRRAVAFWKYMTIERDKANLIVGGEHLQRCDLQSHIGQVRNRDGRTLKTESIEVKVVYHKTQWSQGFGPDGSKKDGVPSIYSTLSKLRSVMVLEFICSSCLSSQRQNRRLVSGWQ